MLVVSVFANIDIISKVKDDTARLYPVSLGIPIVTPFFLSIIEENYLIVLEEKLQ